MEFKRVDLSSPGKTLQHPGDFHLKVRFRLRPARRLLNLFGDYHGTLTYDFIQRWLVSRI
jgi:hypothetical protein